MTAVKRRIGFGALVVILAVLLFFFSTAYLLRMILILAALFIICLLLIRVDARHLSLSAKLVPGAQAGRSVGFTLTASSRGKLLAAGSMAVEIEIQNIMFGTTETKQLVIPLQKQKQALHAELTLELCGETAVRCIGAKVWDPLGLFSVACVSFSEVRTVCYPKPMSLELSLSRDTAGAANTEGMMQNRKGSDPSETFDIREYTPGDDVRSIHWKLSCKTDDSLILREASEPSHYDVVLLPDLGRAQGDTAVSREELNSAASLTKELGEQLLMQGVSFCLVIPGSKGLQILEITSRQELQRMLPQWLGLAIPEQSGTGLDFFLAEHLEQYFTRLLIVSAGKYTQDVNGLGKRIGVEVISTSDDLKTPVYTSLGAGSETVVLPSEQKRGERYKIAC